MGQYLANLAKQDSSQETIIESNVVKIKLNDNKKVEFDENYQDPKVTFKDIGKGSVHYHETETKHLLKCSVNPFVEAVRIAYGYHYPLVITPDIIWYLISSGVCKYINNNAEELRYKFVDHEGKKDIIVELTSLNNWNKAIEQFSEKIQSQTKTDVANLIINDFSTTTKCSKLVSEIVMMDSFKEYFKYKVMCVCGIPEIQIKGTQNDWLHLREKMRNLLKEFPELKNWSAKLKIILEHFINAYDNKVDYDFWNQIYLLDSFKKQFSSYGRLSFKKQFSSYGRLSFKKNIQDDYESEETDIEIKVINGWMIYLFLYVGNSLNQHALSEDNQILNLSPKGDYEIENFKHFLNKAPFIIEDNGVTKNYLFSGGLIGLDKDKENNDALTPIFGIAVLDDMRIKKNGN